MAEVGERSVDGFGALTLRGEGAGGIEATLVPAAGMVCCSLRHRGEELLGQRGGLREYVADRSTMGIPLLHPWANRVGSWRFALAGLEVDLEAASPPPSTDPGGLPIHGLLAAAPGWEVLRHGVEGGAAVLEARFEFTEQPGLMAAFPFPHELFLEASLEGATLTLATTVRATGVAPVPISFGFHPYLRLPGLPRAEWEVEIPVTERLALDARMLPTGEREPVLIEPGPLGDRTFDDAFDAPPAGEAFALSGGGRRIELELLSGYPYSQVYAPAGDEVVAFEPMTAPTNALCTGGVDLPMLEPGEDYGAAFSVTVAEA
ncbi:MAG: aldose 1-epimerase [Solirubrobacterales bacterium]